MRRVIRHLREFSERMRPLQRRLSRKLPSTAHAQKLHIPLICAIVTQLDYTAKTSGSDLVRGMPIVGEIPRTAALPTKETPATMSLHDVRWEVLVTNGEVLKSISKSAEMILKQK